MAGLVLTPEWVDEIYQLETSDPVMGGPDGIDNRQAIQLGKRTEYLKQEVEKRASIESPMFTGTPTAPTAPVGTNNKQIATTQFVAAAIAALVGSAPATLDTLAEIATALGADGNLKETLLAEIGKKANETDFKALKDSLVGVPIPYPLSQAPSGYLIMQGQAFNKNTYPKLAQKYPSGVLPDLRGEFIRGWDNGRKVDSGRALLSTQNSELLSHTHDLRTVRYGTNGVFNSTTSRFDIINNVGWTIGADGLLMGPNRDVYEAKSEQVWGSGNTKNTGGSETRPRNIAFNYICLAA